MPWHDSCVPVVLLIAAAAILCGVIVVAMGRGGELAQSAADSRPLNTEILTAADVALLRPPVALWGYDIRATDEALNLAARTVTEREVEIARLRRQIAELQSAARNPVAPEAPGSQPPDGPATPGTPLPPPLARGIGTPLRSPDQRPWSAWDRPRPAPLPDPGEPGENG
jgi:hypothetical protein